MNTGVIKLSYKILKVSEGEWDNSKECKQRKVSMWRSIKTILDISCYNLLKNILTVPLNTTKRSHEYRKRISDSSFFKTNKLYYFWLDCGKRPSNSEERSYNKMKQSCSFIWRLVLIEMFKALLSDLSDSDFVCLRLILGHCWLMFLGTRNMSPARNISFLSPTQFPTTNNKTRVQTHLSWTEWRFLSFPSKDQIQMLGVFMTSTTFHDQ